MFDHLGHFLKYINDPLKMGRAAAESKQSKYSNCIFKSFSHRVPQLIIHICHSVTHKHTQRQVFSLSAARHVLHQWDRHSLFPWWHWTKQHVVLFCWKKERERADVHTITLTTHTHTHLCSCAICACIFPTHTHTGSDTHMHTQNNTHRDTFLIASNSQHVHASLVSCCLRGV